MLPTLLQAFASRQHPLEKRVVNGLHHVDALGSAAVVPGVHAGTQPGTLGGTVQVGIGTDNHGVVTTQFQGDRNELASAGLGDLAPGGHAARERNLVDAALDNRRTGLAVTE